MIAKGMKKAGKKLIEGIIVCVRDNGMEPRLQMMLEDAHLPTNYEEITSDESEDESEEHLANNQATVSPHYTYPNFVNTVYFFCTNLKFHFWANQYTDFFSTLHDVKEGRLTYFLYFTECA